MNFCDTLINKYPGEYMISFQAQSLYIWAICIFMALFFSHLMHEKNTK